MMVAYLSRMLESVKGAGLPLVVRLMSMFLAYMYYVVLF